MEPRDILLEPSPYESDGGHLIGRDPRKITTEDFGAAGIVATPVLSAIRAKCLDCCVNQESEVRKCTAVACALWRYRMSSNPFRAKTEMSDERRAAAGERLKAARRAATKTSP
jgi:hypothetical protein